MDTWGSISAPLAQHFQPRQAPVSVPVEHHGGWSPYQDNGGYGSAEK